MNPNRCNSARRGRLGQPCYGLQHREPATCGPITRTGEPKMTVLPAPSSPQRLKDLMKPLDLTFPQPRSQEEHPPRNRILALPITM